MSRLTFTSNSLNLDVSSTTLLALLFEVSNALFLVVNCVPLYCHFFFLNNCKCDMKNGFVHILLRFSHNTITSYHYQLHCSTVFSLRPAPSIYHIHIIKPQETSSNVRFQDWCKLFGKVLGLLIKN